MGLDMYLRADIDLGNWRHSTDHEKHKAKALFELVGIQPAPEVPIAQVLVTVIYWRNAYAIDGWLADNSKDNKTQEFYVSSADLLKLLSVCKQVISAKSAGVAKDLLPADGWGPYGDHYFEIIQKTIIDIERVLEMNVDDFMYEASRSI